MRTASDIDGRTRAAKRAKELAAAYTEALGGEPTLTPALRAAVDRVAQLTALCEDARARRLAGDSTISLDDIVRLDSAANRATRALGLKPGPLPRPTETWEAYLERTAREAAERESAARTAAQSDRPLPHQDPDAGERISEADSGPGEAAP